MVECYFCGLKSGMGEAQADGWYPSFYRGDDEVFEPVCPQCAKEYCTLDNDELLVVNEPNPVDDAITRIAKRFYKHPLESRGSDRADFHEVYCVTMAEALRAAFVAGRQMGTK